MLLAREFRAGGPGRTGDKLNFLGGKRRKKETRPLDCAVDKVYDETAGQLSAATMAHMREGCPLVCWNNESKYVFFLFELVGEDDCEVDIRCAGVPGAKRLEWVTQEQLLDSTWTQSQMHPFAKDMLLQLTSCRIMSHLEDLFDVATAPLPEQATTCQQGKSPKEVADHFDISDAISSNLQSAVPHHPLLSSPPSYTELRSAVRIIPKQDTKKLRLRFHPDRLVRVIGHPPSGDEARMSTIAMQILNALVEKTSGAEKDVVDNLQILGEMRHRLSGCSAENNNMAQVRDLLSQLSMSAAQHP
jgi:hypothetical protein